MAKRTANAQTKLKLNSAQRAAYHAKQTRRLSSGKRMEPRGHLLEAEDSFEKNPAEAPQNAPPSHSQMIPEVNPVLSEHPVQVNGAAKNQSQAQQNSPQNPTPLYLLEVDGGWEEYKHSFPAHEHPDSFQLITTLENEQFYVVIHSKTVQQSQNADVHENPSIAQIVPLNLQADLID